MEKSCAEDLLVHFKAACAWQSKSYRFPKISSYNRKEGEHFFIV